MRNSLLTFLLICSLSNSAQTQINIRHLDCRSFEATLATMQVDATVTSFLEKEMAPNIWRKISSYPAGRVSRYDNLNDGVYRVSYVKKDPIEFETRVNNQCNPDRIYVDHATVYISESVDIPCEAANQTASGLTFSSHDDIRVFPNPAMDRVYVSGISKLNIETNFTFTTTDGKEILRGSLQKNDWIDVTSLPTGVYFLDISNGEYQLRHLCMLHIAR